LSIYNHKDYCRVHRNNIPDDKKTKNPNKHKKKTE
jgi:hypothetical protein